MADEADLTDEAIQRMVDSGIARARKQASVLKPMGWCHNCAETFGADDVHRRERLFCDCDCQSDYERRQRAQRINPTLVLA